MPSLSEMSDVFFKSIEGDDDDKGTKWAILVAASPDLEANVCEAYRIMKNCGLNDDNILVFRDVEDDPDDMPSHGVIPDEPIPVDYTTTHATIHRILKAALLADATPLVSGSGKLLESCSDDHIFLYYVSHDTTGLLRPMRVAEKVVANELTFILGEMDTKRRYKSMVVYVEADSSLSEGSLPSDIRIYARTFADHHGNVYRRVGDFPANKDRFEDLTGTTLTEESYEHGGMTTTSLVRLQNSLIRNTPRIHVMRYGDGTTSELYVSTYFRWQPEGREGEGCRVPMSLIPSDCTLLYYHMTVEEAPVGSEERIRAEEELEGEFERRRKMDFTLDKMVKGMCGPEMDAYSILDRSAGHVWPDMDSESGINYWIHYDAMSEAYREVIGEISPCYWGQYPTVIQELMDEGMTMERMEELVVQALLDFNQGRNRPINPDA
ncbi:hypothetical protein MLD38_008575 [Melastoma candidum]|uniref:Uncharacterized protein n=1 Tax=Melastoma candidum TaxID=119954 RepID=A0ACB9RW20_9MYRT|nr:hypothetical protein MLD38_008575 [Melastoma candidum]